VNGYSTIVKFTTRLSYQSFHVTNIYGPIDPIKKPCFITCLYNFDTSVIDRSRPRGNNNEMFFFHDVIHHLDLVEISL
jgi:hypothetical protein